MAFSSTAAPGRWTQHLATAVALAAVVACVGYWAAILLAPPVAIAPGSTLVNLGSTVDPSVAARLLGASGAQAAQGKPGSGAVSAPSNLKVLGVAASSERGSAVLSVDGKPPRAYMVGDTIGSGMTMVEVRSDAVVILRAGARVELPAPARPDTAVLSAGPARSGGSQATGDPGSVRRPAPGIQPASPRPAASLPTAAARAGGPGVVETSESSGDDADRNGEQDDSEQGSQADEETRDSQATPPGAARGTRLMRVD